jgi:hypothetical protein
LLTESELGQGEGQNHATSVFRKLLTTDSGQVVCASTTSRDPVQSQNPPTPLAMKPADGQGEGQPIPTIVSNKPGMGQGQGQKISTLVSIRSEVGQGQSRNMNDITLESAEFATEMPPTVPSSPYCEEPCDPLVHPPLPCEPVACPPLPPEPEPVISASLSLQPVFCPPLPAQFMFQSLLPVQPPYVFFNPLMPPLIRAVHPYPMGCFPMPSMAFNPMVSQHLGFQPFHAPAASYPTPADEDGHDTVSLAMSIDDEDDNERSC